MTHSARHRGCGAWVGDRKRSCGACGVECPCSSCKSARPPLLDTPNDCVVLGVDAASRSGWSRWVRARFIRDGCGEVRAKRLDEVAPVVAAALQLARDHGLPCVMAIEASPFAGRTVMTAHGMGKSVGQWQMAWIAGGGVEAHVVEVTANEWRKDLWGVAPRSDPARAREAVEARAIVGRDCGPEASPGVLIGHWGCYSPAVNALLPRKHRQEVA